MSVFSLHIACLDIIPSEITQLLGICDNDDLETKPARNLDRVQINGLKLHPPQAHFHFSHPFSLLCRRLIAFRKYMLTVASGLQGHPALNHLSLYKKRFQF